MMDTSIFGLDPGAARRKRKYDRRLIRQGWDPAVVALMPAPPQWFYPPPYREAWQKAYDSLLELNRLPQEDRETALGEVAMLLERKCPCCGQVIRN